jgi:hypothetical protein
MSSGSKTRATDSGPSTVSVLSQNTTTRLHRFGRLEQHPPQSLKGSQIYSLYCGGDGRVYYTDEKGVGVFDRATSHNLGLPPGMPPFSAKQVIERPDRSLIIPLRNGGGLWRWSVEVWSPFETRAMPKGTALVIFLDHKQRLWAGYAKDQIGVLTTA